MDKRNINYHDFDNITDIQYIKEIINIININSCYSNENNLLHVTWKNPTTEIANILLDAGINIDKQNSKGNTPIHNAYDNPKLIKLLLEYGADPNIKNEDGYTPLHYFFSHIYRNNKQKDEECIELLKFMIEKGANPYIVNNKGIYVFDMTIHEEIREILLTYHGNCKTVKNY